MDTLEQARIAMYRAYPSGIGYGFGCRSKKVDERDVLEASASYYTLSYTPANGDWNGKYRTNRVEETDKELQLAYRKGYYGTPENSETHYYTAQQAGASSAPPASGGSTITAATVVPGNVGSEGTGSGSVKTPPNPVEAVFSVEVVPADGLSAATKEKQETRQLTLHFAMPASEFKVVPSNSGQYVARLEIGAVPYADGGALETYGSQVVASFDSATDTRIANSTITAKMTVNMPEHGHNRSLYVSVRDVATGQSGDMVIPMEQVKMPGTQ
jgi:hypothetical protein